MSDDDGGLEGAQGLPNYIKTKPIHNPTADAAKLLPCPICSGISVHLNQCPNGCPQPAQPEGEPVGVRLIHELMSLNDCSNWPDYTGERYKGYAEAMESVGQLVDDFQRPAYEEQRLGLAARPKVEDAFDVDLRRVKDIARLITERDEARERLAEREAELAKADAIIADDVSVGVLNGPERRKIIRVACKRHAARQQQKP